MKYLLLILIVLCSGCDKQSGGKKYFEYDEILHFKNDVDEALIGDLYNNKSKLDSLKFGVILDDIPKSIVDTTYLNILQDIGYTKTTIDQKKFKAIDEIFTEKKHPEGTYFSCIYVYRDILVFKRKSKIVGMAKICFDCGGSQIFGTKSNTEEFGQSGDYESLAEILER
jgi:hypothetical protein